MRLLKTSKFAQKLLPVFLANIFFSFHYNVLVYVNSSFLQQFFSTKAIALLFILGSIGNILLFVLALKMEHKYGNRVFFSRVLLIELIAVAGLTIASNAFAAAALFILFQAAFHMVVLSLDIFLEDASRDTNTGSIRGVYLTLGNLALVLSPLLIALIAPNGEFRHLYIVSALFLMPLFYLATFSFKKFKDGRSRFVGFPFKAWQSAKNIQRVTYARLALHTFFSLMVIFMPIYLKQYIGFSWTEISIIFTIMLLPFVLFEIPVGRLADKWCGEKELMTLGLFIIGVALLIMPFIETKSILLWAVVLFVSRAGASITEITTESYFFKHVDKRDVGLIYIFRLSWPVGFIIGPLVALISLSFLPFSALFIIFALMMLKSMESTTKLRDTK
jgi:MFS family permease